MKKVRYVRLLLVLAVAVFSFSLVAFASDPPVEVGYTAGNYVSVDSVIKVKFDMDVALNSSHNIKLYNTTIPASPEEVAVKSVKTLGDTLYITPKSFLAVNEDYRLDVPANSVLNASYKVLGNAAPITFTFKTGFYNFKTHMTNGGVENLINVAGYTAREIKVYAPKKYITNIDVIHKKSGKVTGAAESFGAITIIDVRADKDVSYVTVAIDGGAASTASLVEAGTTKLLTKTLTGLPSSFDVTVKAYNKNSVEIDSQIVNIASTTDSVITKKERFSSATAGKVFTLYELLAKPTTFVKLLNENSMDKLMLQVDKLQWIN